MLTIDVQTALICLLILAGVVLGVYLIVMVYNLTKTLKHLQTVLADFSVVSKIASERAKQLDKLISEASKKLKASKGILSSIPVIFKTIGQIVKVVGRKDEKKE